MRKPHEHSVSLSEETERNIDFYYHSIEDHIESLAEQAGNKNLVPAITSKLVRLLEAKALWETFRDTQSLPEMWSQRNGDRRGRWPRGAPRTMEANLSGNAPGTRSLSKKARKAISKAQQKRWAQFHREKQRVKGSPAYEAQRAAAIKPRKPRRISAATRAKISAARKAWWAAQKKAGAA